MGANVIISNHIGQNDRRSIRDAISTVGLVAIVSGLLMMVVGILVARPILTMMDTPADVLDMAITYLRIYFLGIPFFMIFDFGSAILRSMGDTRRPLYILVAAGIVNTILNLVFVIIFHMGVTGVAIATSIANAVSAALIIYLLLHEKEPYRLRPKKLYIEWKELKRMLQIGVPAGLQGMVFSISNVLLQASINGYGSDAIAGSAAALNFEYYCYFIIGAFNGAAISFTGQNYGAGLNHRVKRIFAICLFMGFVGCAALNWFFIWQEDFFLSLFTDSPAVIVLGKTRMHIALAWQSIAAFYEISGSVLRGMGKSMEPTLITVFGTCLLRIAWIFIIMPGWRGFDHLLAVYPVSWTITTVMMLGLYFWRTRTLLALKS